MFSLQVITFDRVTRIRLLWTLGLSRQDEVSLCWQEFSIFSSLGYLLLLCGFEWLFNNVYPDFLRDSIVCYQSNSHDASLGVPFDLVRGVGPYARLCMLRSLYTYGWKLGFAR